MVSLRVELPRLASGLYFREGKFYIDPLGQYEVPPEAAHRVITGKTTLAEVAEKYFGKKVREKFFPTTTREVEGAEIKLTGPYTGYKTADFRERRSVAPTGEILVETRKKEYLTGEGKPTSPEKATRVRESYSARVVGAKPKPKYYEKKVEEKEVPPEQLHEYRQQVAPAHETSMRVLDVPQEVKDIGEWYVREMTGTHPAPASFAGKIYFALAGEETYVPEGYKVVTKGGKREVVPITDTRELIATEARREAAAFVAGATAQFESAVEPIANLLKGKSPFEGKAPSIYSLSWGEKGWTQRFGALLGGVSGELSLTVLPENLARAYRKIPRLTREGGKWFWKFNVELPKGVKGTVKFVDEGSEMVVGVVGKEKELHGVKGVSILREMGGKEFRARTAEFIPVQEVHTPVVKEEIRGVRDFFKSLKRGLSKKQYAETTTIPEEVVNKMLERSFKPKSAGEVVFELRQTKPTKVAELGGNPPRQLQGLYPVLEKEGFSVSREADFTKFLERTTKLGETEIPMRVEQKVLSLRGQRTGRFGVEVPSIVEVPKELRFGLAGGGKKSSKGLFEMFRESELVEEVGVKFAGGAVKTATGTKGRAVVASGGAIPRVMRSEEAYFSRVGTIAPKVETRVRGRLPQVTEGLLKAFMTQGSLSVPVSAPTPVVSLKNVLETKQRTAQRERGRVRRPINISTITDVMENIERQIQHSLQKQFTKRRVVSLTSASLKVFPPKPPWKVIELPPFAPPTLPPSPKKRKRAKKARWRWIYGERWWDIKTPLEVMKKL